ncbi:Protein glass [Aphelenchoides bicaudatus]|nr:Protein glass [Aphelenchoides bicaudatus]
MSTYSSYTGDFFGHPNQPLSHLGPQQPLQHEPMLFNPAPTYYATNTQNLIYPPQPHPDHAATAFHFYQPTTQSTWPDAQQFDINYAANPFDYSTLGASNTSIATNNLKHWPPTEPFTANASLLASTTTASTLASNSTDMLMNFPSAITSTPNNETNTSTTVISTLGENNTQTFTELGHKTRSGKLPLRLVVDPKRDLKPQRALNARQLQLQNPSAKIYTCTQCNRQYCRKSTLKAHMKQHNGGERQFVCNCCGKTFTQAANLTAHQRVHTGEKPFACSICLRPFSQSSSLVTHRRTHTGERPYPCPHCTKSFTDSSTLTKHMRTHSGIKPYSCHLCMMRFSQSGNLHRHMKTHRMSA